MLLLHSPYRAVWPPTIWGPSTAHCPWCDEQLVAFAVPSWQAWVVSASVNKGAEKGEFRVRQGVLGTQGRFIPLPPVTTQLFLTIASLFHHIGFNPATYRLAFRL